MKKAVALAVVMAFCAVIGLAGTGEHHGTAMEGTITKVDMAGKSMVVKGADGKETTLYWNDSTKLQGTPKEGEMVHYKAAEKDGKSTASWVHVGAMQPKAK